MADEPGGPRPTVRVGISLAYHPDGHRLAVGGTSRPVQVWDADIRRPLLDLGQPNFIQKQSVAFTPDGNQLIASNRPQLRFWDATPSDPAARRAQSDRRAAAWHAQRAEADRLLGEGFGADFHATRAVALDPDQPAMYATRGEARSILGRATEATADHNRALALASARLGPPPLVPGDADVWHKRGEALARQGQWAGAAEAHRFAAWHNPAEPLHWNNLATAQLAAGDTAGHRATCRAMLQRFLDRPESAYLLMLAAAGTTDFTAGEWERVARAVGGDRAAAVAHYRSGQHREAIQALARAQYKAHPQAWEMLIRSMAYRKLNRPADANHWLARARVWMIEADRVADNPTAWGNTRWPSWNDRVMVRELLRETEALTAPASRN